MTNHLENLKDGYARAKTDTERRAFLRAALRVMAQNAHDLEECCLGLVGILDARRAEDRALCGPSPHAHHSPEGGVRLTKKCGVPT